jgi:hypothetical protein
VHRSTPPRKVMRRRRRRWKLVTRLWLSGVILAVVAFIGLPVIGEEEAQTVRLKAESDGVIYADKPDETSGDEPELVIDKQPHSSALIRFKLSDVSADITSARLRLHALTPIGSPLLITLTENTWSESGLSFNNRPSRASGIVAESFLGDGSWIEVDVTELIPSTNAPVFTGEQSSS